MKNNKSIIFIVVGVLAAVGLAVGIYFACFGDEKKEEIKAA